MNIFEKMTEFDHEQIIFCQDRTNGLKAIIAIHNTNLGPALGGCRIYEYASEAAALEDALRLSKGMTYKNAAADLRLGGAKAVIMIDKDNPKTPYMIKSFASFVEKLHGRYITSKDVGVSGTDLVLMKAHTKYVAGDQIPPSYYTAVGVFQGILASAMYKWHHQDLTRKTIAIQGIGAVGYDLARLLHQRGAKLIVADPDKKQLIKAQQELNAQVVELDEIYDVDCDIFAPCAMGGTINPATIKRIKAAIIAGSANNQLSTIQDGQTLHAQNVLYAPDYIINAGGVIAVAGEIEHESIENILIKCNLVYDRLLEVYKMAQVEKISPAQAADLLTEMHLQKINHIMKKY